MKSTLESKLHELRKEPEIRSVDWIGLRQVKENSKVRVLRDGKIEKYHSNVTEGIMIEILVNGQLGYAATPSMDSSSLKRAAFQALQLATTASDYKLFTNRRGPTVKSSNAEISLPHAKRLLEFRSHVKMPAKSNYEKDILDLLTEICVKLKCSPKIIRTSAWLETHDISTHYLDMNGLSGSQFFHYFSSDFDATACSSESGSGDRVVIQKRTDGGNRGRSFQGGVELLLENPWQKQLWERVQKVGEQALELINAPECPRDIRSLVLMPDQMMLQIHESIGHPLELDRILGDERNYAGWSFVKIEDFGKLRYGSDLLNVVFDPTVVRENASYGFDDTGWMAKKEYLIKNGILVRSLGGIESQARSYEVGIHRNQSRSRSIGQEASEYNGVACTRASSWNRPPIDRMGNINVEPGSSSLSEILSSVEKGILMETNRSWSIDDFRNKFQFGCEYARLIENGKITRTVRNPNYRGVTLPFWMQLKKVGNTSTLEMYGTPFCGKGEPNQAIRVGHSSPVCLFENVEIFGGVS